MNAALRRFTFGALALCCALPCALAQNSFGGPPPGPAPGPSALKGGGNVGDQGERQDFGVAAKKELHTGAMHGPTPASIPGGQIITTQALIDLRRTQPKVLVFDVLGGPEALPGALGALPAHQAGSFDDAVQRQFGQYLQQVTQGSKAAWCSTAIGSCWVVHRSAAREPLVTHFAVVPRWIEPESAGPRAEHAKAAPLKTAQCAAVFLDAHAC